MTVAQPTVLSRRNFASELRALKAIAWKEWVIFRRYPSWVLAIFIWPVLFPVGYIFSAKALGGPNGAALDMFQRLTGTSDYVSFIVVGSVLWMWLNMTLWDLGMYLRSEQMRGTLESNWLCPTWRVSLMLGGALTKLATSLVFMAIALLEFRLFFGVQVLGGNLGLALLVLLLVIPTIHGIGIAFASLVLRFKEANALVFLVRGIFMIFCGITYPSAVLPGWMQNVAAALPLTYAIRDIRAVVLANATLADILPDLVVLTAFAVAMPALGYGLFYLTERRARRVGDLGQY
jgi:ABC-2 type transport system permease protein